MKPRLFCSAAVPAAVWGRLARLRARDALATAGKMPALLSLAQRFRIHVIEKTRRIPAAGFVQELLLCTD